MRLEEGKPRHRLVKLRPATVAIKAVSPQLSDSTVPGTNCTRYLKVCMGQNGWVRRYRRAESALLRLSTAGRGWMHRVA